MAGRSLGETSWTAITPAQSDSVAGKASQSSKSMCRHVTFCILLPRLWLTYVGRPNEACIPSRQVAFSSNTRETAFLHLSFPKTRVNLRNHADDSILETSSHYSHVSGLKFPIALPKMATQLKEGILGAEKSEKPEKWPCAGVPLFWQESKSSTVYEKLFPSLNVGMVIDMEAGSGQAGLAAMQSDCVYVGVCKDAAHAGWVANILDKQALAMMVTTGHMLFNQTLMDSINDIFSAVSCLLASAHPGRCHPFISPCFLRTHKKGLIYLAVRSF